VAFWEVLLSIVVFMAFVAWIWLLVAILGDLFRDHELSGWSKALWTLFIVVIPWLGTLVYVIARGRAMNERALARARLEEHDPRYARPNPGGGGRSVVDELTRLADLRDRGKITPEEFVRAKGKLLGAAAPGPPAARADSQAPPAEVPAPSP
jgi:hypothetical protein